MGAGLRRFLWILQCFFENRRFLFFELLRFSSNSARTQSVIPVNPVLIAEQFGFYQHLWIRVIDSNVGSVGTLRFRPDSIPSLRLSYRASCGRITSAVRGRRFWRRQENHSRDIELRTEYTQQSGRIFWIICQTGWGSSRRLRFRSHQIPTISQSVLLWSRSRKWVWAVEKGTEAVRIEKGQSFSWGKGVPIPNAEVILDRESAGRLLHRI